LEEIVAKRLDNAYESGKRSSAWGKIRVNRAQEFVIGGYTVGGRLMYATRTPSGFTPAVREQLHQRFRGLGRRISTCGHSRFVGLREA
jgi:bifunctional non-homologous end joining protein LigD